MIYKKVLRPFLFLFDPEVIHKIVLFLFRLPLVNFFISAIYHYESESLKRHLFGIDFPNPVGLAAGFDKEASHINTFSAIGFGFVEIGTITPLGQSGNPKPRLFRLKQDQAIINRMGFNNAGVIKAVQHIKKANKDIIIGGNIGKNKITPNDQAADDYIKCFNILFDYVNFFVINVSSPNTPGLRDLQEKEPLKYILNSIREQNRLKPTPKPVLLKISPDLTNTQLDDIIDIVLETGIDGIVATNTTISREKLSTSESALKNIGAGGLSGRPVFDRSNEIIHYIKSRTDIPVIGVGGIMSADDALVKIKAGADLIQIYTGFIYEGPELIRQIKKKLAEYYLSV